MKFRKGDKVKILGCSCRNQGDFEGCCPDNKLGTVLDPYYEDDETGRHHVHILFDGEKGCSGYTEDDLELIFTTWEARYK